MGVAATATVGGSATITLGLGMVGATTTGMVGAVKVGGTVFVTPVLQHLQASAPLWHRYVQLRPLRKQEHDFVSHLPLQVHLVRE